MKQRSGEPAAEPRPVCTHNLTVLLRLPPDPESLERAAGLFRAMGDAARLRILHMLLRGEVCVGEIVTALGEKFSTVSQRLRILRSEGLVRRRRDGSHVYYVLADDHVKELVANALAHASELDGPSTTQESEDES
jgi:ArsR family transcriptional regulator, lead/cadmium/zinc/bismuth-responsive transcriptional repressor